MSPYYRRTTPGTRENVTAALVSAGLAAGIASVTFYLVRTFLAREPLEPRPDRKPGRQRGSKLGSSRSSSATE